MSWFHKCNWIVVEKTYSPPLLNGMEVKSCSEATFKKLSMGCTTILFQCSKCKRLHKEEMLGKIK